MNIRIFTVLCLGLLLTACGTTPTERGINGAGIGAGAGAIVGAVTGLSVAQGAVLGAVAGGLTGALTDKEDVDLGEPVYRDSRSTSSAAGNQTVVEIQKGLRDMGYNPGAVDGINGKQTREAIRQYQRDNGLLVDGQATPALAAHIKQHS